jgi:hypothetical protein
VRFPALPVENIQFLTLSAVELRKMRFQSAVFPLHPQLFQVKRQREQE